MPETLPAEEKKPLEPDESRSLGNHLNAPKKSSFLSFILQFLVIAAVFFAIGFSFGQKKIEVEKRSFVKPASTKRPERRLFALLGCI